MAYNLSPAFAALGIMAFDSTLSPMALPTPTSFAHTPVSTAPILTPAPKLETPEYGRRQMMEEKPVERVANRETGAQKVMLYSCPPPMNIN